MASLCRIAAEAVLLAQRLGAETKKRKFQGIVSAAEDEAALMVVESEGKPLKWLEGAGRKADTQLKLGC